MNETIVPEEGGNWYVIGSMADKDVRGYPPTMGGFDKLLGFKTVNAKEALEQIHSTEVPPVGLFKELGWN